MKKNILLPLLIFFGLMNSQIGIGITTPNKHSAIHIESTYGTGPKRGVMLPKINNTDKTELENLLTLEDKGLAYLNITTDCILTWEGTKFNTTCPQGKAVYTADCVNSKLFGIYRQGYSMSSAEFIKLSVNVTEEGPYSISGSVGNGYYFSSTGYLTTGLQDIIVPAFGSPTNEKLDKLVLRNTMSSSDLCEFDINILSGGGKVTIDCDKINPPKMVQGSTSPISIQIPVNVDLTGPLLIKETSEINGVKFNGNANFTSTGPGTITITSIGTPINTGEYTYAFKDSYGTECSFKINVVANVTTITQPTTVEVLGTYAEGVDLSPQQKIKGVNFSPTGIGGYGIKIEYLTGGTGNPGLQFEQKDGTITTITPFSVIFNVLANSVPNQSGDFKYQFVDIYTGLTIGDPFTITINPLVGGFKNPALTCNHIFTAYNTPTNLLFNDGEYWIGTPTAKYKTQCDMVSSVEALSQNKTVGGYTLVWSISERNFLDTYNIGGTNQFSSQGDQVDWQYDTNDNRSVVTSETGTVNYDNFRITSNEKRRLVNVNGNNTGNITRLRFALNSSIPNIDDDSHTRDNYAETTLPTTWINGNTNFANGGQFNGKWVGKDVYSFQTGFR